jgi:predicted RNase H-like nuclease (RuvC/YqgF family)
MTDTSDLITYQTWCSEQLGVIEALREDKHALQDRIKDLENKVAMLTSMVERLHVALSQGGEQ